MNLVGGISNSVLHVISSLALLEVEVLLIITFLLFNITNVDLLKIMITIILRSPLSISCGLLSSHLQKLNIL